MATTYYPFQIELTDGQKRNYKKLIFQKQLCLSELNQSKLDAEMNYF